MIRIFFCLEGRGYIRICLIRGEWWNVIYRVIWRGILTLIEGILFTSLIYWGRIMQREYLMWDPSMHWNCCLSFPGKRDWRCFEIGGLQYNKVEHQRRQGKLTFDENSGKIQRKSFFQTNSPIESSIRHIYIQKSTTILRCLSGEFPISMPCEVSS